MFLTVASWLLIMAGLVVQQSSSAPAAGPALDFAFYRTRVEPIFLAKRPGHARCVSCHGGGTPMRLQPLLPGSTTWTEEQSRQNFDIVRQRVIPGSLKSKLLLHPLAAEAGGDPFHNGGKYWESRSAAEWRTLAAWVNGKKGAESVPTKVRIIQTNSAGDNVSLIDPVTNKVVGEIKDIEVNHGAAVAPDGSRLYVTNEAASTLDVVDARTLLVTRRIPLSGHPNNLSISRDGTRVYVAIAQAPGAVDVIDTTTQERAKSIAVKGAVHNTYVTPDGKFVVAGSVAGRNVTVIDVQTEEPAWSMDFDLGVRPMAFDKKADGSTNRMFVQLSDLHGFAVVDFQARKEVTRITLPPLPPGKVAVHEGGNISHGIAVTPDGKALLVNSRTNSALYAYALPDLKVLGGADIGTAPNWIALTPDGKTAYVANAGSRSVSVVDVASMRETTRIPVGHVPKRNTTAALLTE